MLAAFLAGIYPNKTPMTTQTLKDNSIDHSGTILGIEKSGKTHSEAAIPSNTPKIPPVTLIMMDSIRNCTLITKPVAPTAILKPISFVRSVTDTSMMFIIPIPAINNEKPAAIPRISVTVSIVDDRVSIISACERMVKSSASSSFILWLRLSIFVSSSIASSDNSSVIAEHTIDEK